jgi:hypothetical protein
MAAATLLIADPAMGAVAMAAEGVVIERSQDHSHYRSAFAGLSPASFWLS